MYVDHFWRPGLSGDSGRIKAEAVSQAGPALESGDRDQSGLAGCGDGLIEGNGRYYMAGRLLPECFRKDGGILHVPDRTVYQCGLIHPVRADVHRRVARLYRRRYQDQYLLRDISGDTGHVHEEDGPRLPPEHLQAECFKSIYDHDSFWHGRRHCGIFDVYSGTGFQFHAALL